jgi:DNA-directed RNA polymerase omega subunit
MEQVDKDYSEDRTLGLTSQAAVAAVGNRYDLVLIAAQRVRELHRGHRPRVETRHGPVLTALKEIEQGLVDRKYLLKSTDADRKHRGHR